MVSLRDGKTYDPSADSLSVGSSRRRSTAPPSAQRPAPSAAQRPRRSTRLANTSAEEEDSVPFQQEEPVTPARGKRQRPQQLTVVASPAAAADVEDLDASDVANTDQGVQLHEAAAMDLPEDSPSAPPSAKKPRIPAAYRTPTPSKAAAAANKLRRETMSVSIAAAVMVLFAAVAMAALLPALAPHRANLKQSVLQAAAHTKIAYVQPLKVRAVDSFDAAKVQIAAASAAAQQQAQLALLQARERISLVQERLPQYAPAWVLEKIGRAQPSTDATGAWSVDALVSILPAGSQWAEYAADVADKLQAPPAQRDNKAPALLLACGSEDDCNEAAAALAVLPPKGEACTLTVNSADLQASEGDSAGQPAAALQAVLAPFLQRCPAGLVVLRGAEDLPVAAVPALLNALSELGGFQHGGKVDAFKAAYALLVQMPPAHVAAAAVAQETDHAAARTKDTFFSLLEGQLHSAAASAPAHESAHWDAVQRSLSPLRRRIEFAAPVRLGTSTEAALDAAREAFNAAAEAAAAA